MVQRNPASPSEAATAERLQTHLEQLLTDAERPRQLAKENEQYVVVERLKGNLDGEQSEQALQALNGMHRED